MRLSFQNILFGTIAGNNGVAFPAGIDFIPSNAEGSTIQISGSDQAAWLGMKNKLMQKYAYDFCAPVASIADKLAEYDLNGEVEILRSTGKGKDNYATNEWANLMNKRLAQPNPLQSWYQFRGQQIVYKKIFGFCPVLPIIPTGFGPEFCVAMINLPPWLFGVKSKKNFFPTKIEDAIEYYTVNLLGKETQLTPDKIFILQDSFMMDDQFDYLLPQSRLVGLDMDISNVCAAKEADNVLLKKKGPLGFIGHDAGAAKDSIAGYIPMTNKGKQEVQDALQQYGLSWNQFQYAITKQPVRWNPMSFDVKELGTKETVVASEKTICHRYNFPYVLYEETDATYANGENAASSVYLNNVIPNNKKDLAMYNKFFKAEENACKITGCFDDVGPLQEDEGQRNASDKTKTERLQLEFDANLITKNMWLEEMGYDKVADGDKYKKDLEVTEPPKKEEIDPLKKDEPITE